MKHILPLLFAAASVLGVGAAATITPATAAVASAHAPHGHLIDGLPACC